MLALHYFLHGVVSPDAHIIFLIDYSIDID
jgi:hypothetical protein